ncbi:protein translocase subunit secF [Oryzihumus leptocrescens]|uniref:Protein-export membrane protein SecF n=1 Tax=Oryzihumus leptocrescens TaxID=297536 RepID=A0A542ZJ55_9MICO|nr:protein translocase subunit SecF [Oryzihumus leptocrescens]TQL60383.1 protein translocase subunit secF [Oryzihumus leptocrescens]
MTSFAQFGNDLYTGKRSIDFVGRQKTWYAISGVILVLALVGIFARGLNLGLEFRGGSELRVSGVSTTQGYEAKAKDALGGLNQGADVVVTKLGSDSVRVQTEKLSDTQTEDARANLAKAFGVDENKISASFIGASWGASVSQKAITALIWFLVLVALTMALYFRTWKMSAAGLIALVHDLVITVGIYALFGFEITPASMIGFLTILGYSLYDTVVVFDKVRENTGQAVANGRMSYSQAANRAVNQTLVRSINTSVVALLPVAAILVIGSVLLGPGVLVDLSLALFVGIAAGTYSSIFIATPLLADLREREPAMKDLAKRAKRYQAARTRDEARAEEAGEADASATAGDETAGSHREPAAAGAGRASRPVHPYVSGGPRNQPKRPPKSKR